METVADDFSKRREPARRELSSRERYYLKLAVEQIIDALTLAQDKLRASAQYVSYANDMVKEIERDKLALKGLLNE